jgi:hypothetical protein
MKTLAAKIVLLVLAVILIFGGGMFAGWKLFGPKQPKTETYAQEIKQKDKSLVLERKPMTQQEAEENVPTPVIPDGGKVERKVQVVVQPNAYPTVVTEIPTSGQLNAVEVQEKPPCPPVRVDLTLVRLPDSSHRVIAQSPDGDIVGGVDIPVQPVQDSKVLKWAVGGVKGRTPDGTKFIGGFVDRDWAFVRVSGAVFRSQDTVKMGWGWECRVGIRF